MPQTVVISRTLCEWPTIVFDFDYLARSFESVSGFRMVSSFEYEAESSGSDASDRVEVR